jgi:hypothetical protein
MGRPGREPGRRGLRPARDRRAASGRERAPRDVPRHGPLGRRRRLRLLAAARIRDGARAATDERRAPHRRVAAARARTRLGASAGGGDPVRRAAARVGDRRGAGDRRDDRAVERRREPRDLRAARRPARAGDAARARARGRRRARARHRRAEPADHPPLTPRRQASPPPASPPPALPPSAPPPSGPCAGVPSGRIAARGGEAQLLD